MKFIDAFYTRLGVPPSTLPNPHPTNPNSLIHKPSVPSTSSASSIPSTHPALGKVFATFDPAHKYVTSPVFRNPLVFSIIRSLIAVYGIATIIVTLFVFAIRDGWAKAYYSFFTYLTFTGITAYYIVASVHTISYYLAWRRRGAGAGYLLQRAGRCNGTDNTSIPLRRTTTRAEGQEKPAADGVHSDNDESQGPSVKWWGRVLQALHVVLASTIVTYPIIVTAVFWSLLASDKVFSSPGEGFNNISVHSLNALFGIIEMVFSNSPPIPWITLPLGILFLMGYLGVAYITKATQGFYTYGFLDPAQHPSPAYVAIYVAGICLGEIIIFCLVRGIMVLREKWAVKNGLVMNVDNFKAMGGPVDGVVDEERALPRDSETTIQSSRAAAASEGTEESWQRV